MEHETVLEELEIEWNANIDSVFGLMDKKETAERFKDLEAADIIIILERETHSSALLWMGGKRHANAFKIKQI